MNLHLTVAEVLPHKSSVRQAHRKQASDVPEILYPGCFFTTFFRTFINIFDSDKQINRDLNSLSRFCCLVGYVNNCAYWIILSMNSFGPVVLKLSSQST